MPRAGEIAVKRFVHQVEKTNGVAEGRLDLGLGPLEARIMDILWEAPGWATVQDVRDALNHGTARQLSYSTIKTVMHNLTEKRYLKKRVIGRAHEYTARSTRTDAERAAVAQFIRPMVAGRSSLIAHLVDELAVSETALAELDQLIDERLRKR